MESDRRALFNAHHAWALRVARGLARRLPPTVQLAEVESAVLEGLWDAAGRWDGQRPFKTFATWRLRGALQDYLRGWLPTGQRRKQSKHRTIRTLPLHVSRDDEQHYEPAARPIRHDADIEDELHRLLLPLPPRARQVMRLYHLDGWLLREIGDHLGLGEARISQILSQAEERLRSYWHQHALERT